MAKVSLLNRNLLAASKKMAEEMWEVVNKLHDEITEEVEQEVMKATWALLSKTDFNQ